jgi:hypothetical protein
MKYLLEKIIHPTKILIAIVVVSIIWILPVFKSENKTQPKQSLTVYAGEHTGLSCSYGCQIDVCTKWVPPSATCQPDNPWDIGCCVRWERQCGPDCEEDPPPNQPPTISHTFTCSQTGNNDWCKGTLSLDLTASDPQNAQVIISGTVNGVAFACPTGNTICSVPISDGQGNIAYRVDSSTGLSDSDTTTYKLDSTTPQIDGSISGTTGLNNWYVSSTTLSATATDSTSAIASFEMNVNNTGWVNYADTTFNDGIHTIQYRATDNAGNVTETAVQEIKVDTVTPVINISITGTSGLSTWYVSNVTLSASSSDVTSGVSVFEMNVDNTGWVNYSDTTFTDGIHTIQYRSTDNAGNIYITAQQEIKVDTTTPNLTLSTTGTKGQNSWYISNTSVTPTASDAGSGVMSIEYSLNNGAFTSYTSPLQFTDGISTYQLRVTDHAGNITTTPSLTLKIDTIAPTVNKDTNIKLGDELSYTLFDTTSGLWIQRVVIEDEDEKYKKIVWLDTISGNQVEDSILWDGKFADKTQAPAGEYYIVFKISDQAGNETFHTTEVQVNALSFLLPIAPFTPPTTNTELPSNELPSDEQEQNFGNENNGNIGAETSNSSAGGEIIFANAIAEAGVTTSSSTIFNLGNENTTTPITNSNILWGAVAAAAVGMTLAEWQKRREEEEKQQQSENANKAGRKKYEEKMRMKRIIGESQVLLDEKKKNQAKQNAVAAARWNGIAQMEKAKEKAKQDSIHNHLMNEHKDQTGVYEGKSNIGGSKPLMKPVKEDEPPEDKSWWEKVTEWWSSLWNSDSKTEVVPTQTLTPTVTATQTITILPSATSTSGQPKIYPIYGPMTIDQIPQEFRCTLPEKKIINEQELYSDYYYRCKLGEKLMEGILTDTNGWWWKDGQTTRWDTGEITEWKAIQNNLDAWNFALALGLDSEGTDLRKSDSRFAELIEQAIYNKFWHFDHGVYPTYGNGVQEQGTVMPLGTNGRLVALGSLESLQDRVTGKDGFVTLNVNASEVIRPPYDGDSTNMWEDAWNYFANNGEPTWIEPSPTAPYEIGNIDSTHPYYKIDEGQGLYEVLYRSPKPEPVRAIVLTFEQFSNVYSQLPK